MSTKERDRLKVLHEAEKGRLTQKQTGVQLKLSERWVRKLGAAVRAKVVRLVKREYPDFGWTGRIGTVRRWTGKRDIARAQAKNQAGEAAVSVPVRNEPEEKLAGRFPRWFNVNGNVRHTLMPFGFQCGDGWYEIVWRLCSDLKPLVGDLEKETGERFQVVQAKQELGTLRFCVSPHTDAIDGSIAEAEEESSRTCEPCGQPRQPCEAGGWIQTLCEEHTEERALRQAVKLVTVPGRRQADRLRQS